MILSGKLVRVGMIAMGLMAAPYLHAAEIRVVVEEARIVGAPKRVATLIIGNPLIADATLIPGGEMVITGKGYGTTNLIALDSRGEELARHSLTVVSAESGTLVMYGGRVRSTYSCDPQCARRFALGDDGDPATQVLRGGRQEGDQSGQSERKDRDKSESPCDTSDQTAVDGSKCGKRAASERPGGE